MVEYDDNLKMNRIFHALSDKTRRSILRRIKEEEFSVSELAEPYDMSLAAVSKHLKVLETAGLIERTKQGKIHWCGLVTEPLVEAELVLKSLSGRL
ncbi:MAG: DNA-binding transcriptional ArsR family regulator [Alphaproteobacteria bacterium]|jgi:DNA-binding transcriptional ArsR family regulator